MWVLHPLVHMWQHYMIVKTIGINGVTDICRWCMHLGNCINLIRSSKACMRQKNEPAMVQTMACRLAAPSYDHSNALGNKLLYWHFVSCHYLARNRLEHILHRISTEIMLVSLNKYLPVIADMREHFPGTYHWRHRDMGRAIARPSPIANPMFYS